MPLVLAGVYAGCAVTASSDFAASSASRAASSPPGIVASTVEAPSTKLSATFVPKRLGAATTVGLTLKVARANYMTPPLSSVDVTYPSDLNLATSGLGLAACDPVALEDLGPEACPANSHMGSGTAEVQVPFGLYVVPERIGLSLFAGPSADGYLHILIFAAGSAPVSGHVQLNAVLLPGHLLITVPQVPSLPGGSDVVFTSITATFGGALTYYERSHGRTIAYRPKGFGLPDSCPAGGWILKGNLAFSNGQHSATRTVISCPRRPAARRR